LTKPKANGIENEKIKIMEKQNKLMTGNATMMLTTTLHVFSRRLINHMRLSLSAVS
jgi:hypothetical protein